MKSLQQISQKSDKNNELLFTAPVMIPGEADCDFHRGEKPFTADEIQNIAEAYKNYGIVEKDHDYLFTHQTVGVAEKSWITDTPMTLKYIDGEETVIPAGTWMATTRITDPTTIKRALNGEFTGYSPTVLNRELAQKIQEASTKSSAGKIIHDIDDPVGFAISLVKSPCLRKAKFCKCNKEKNNEHKDDIMDDVTFKTQLMDFLGLNKNEAEEEVSTKSEKEEVEHEDFVTVQDFEKFKDEFFAAMKSSKPRKQKKPEPDEPDTAEDTNNTPAEDSLSDEDIDKKIAQLQAQIQKLQKMKKGSSNDVAQKGKALSEHEIRESTATKSDAQTVYEIMGRNPSTHMKNRK